MKPRNNNGTYKKRGDYTGLKFGRLTALYFIRFKQYKSNRYPLWKFRCDCGKEIEAWLYNVRHGHTSSCGCLRDETNKLSKNVIHGEGYGGRKFPLYEIWSAIRQRCLNPRHPQFKNYGGRRIKINWTNYQEFKKDMGIGYRAGLQIDRIDNSGDYCKRNCHLATRIQQARNRRNNTFIEFNGQKRCLKEWSEITKLKRGTIAQRLGMGWPIEQALTRPLRGSIAH